MSTETVRCDWLHDDIFLLRDRAGFPIYMTQPGGVNGADLLPLSVIGCAAWDVAAILLKQRQPLAGLRATAVSTRDDEAPWCFRAIHLRYAFSGAGLNQEQARRAVALTEEKYCATLVTLRPAVRLTSEVVFEPAPQESAAAPATTTAMAAGDGPPADPIALVLHFNAALNAGDLDGMRACLTEDTVFENTWPPPDGTRVEGQAAVMDFWRSFLRDSRQPRIETEEIFALDAGPLPRVVMRWTYHWLGDDGQPGHVRGVDLYALSGGRIAEKLSYVKG